MATPPSGSASSGRSPSGSNGAPSGGTSKREKPKPISVRIQPTIGPCFSLSLGPNTKITTLKDAISDRMGLSPHKMTLLLHNNELLSGTLSSNGIDDGTEIRLVPAVESGVTTTNLVDPVAMMKHSMSGISDQQIDDFLNGKSPLSVAIRVGESVVVVNLHRAKVEEIEVEPPPTKRRCTRARRPSSEESSSPRSSPGSSRHLNTNTCSSTDELMDTSEHLSASSMHRRASSRYMDHSIRTGHDRHPNPSPNTALTTPSPIVVGESSSAASSSGCRSTGLGGVHPHSLGGARPPCVADTSSHLTRSSQGAAAGIGGGSVGGASHSHSSASSPVISNLLKSSAPSPSSPPVSRYSSLTSSPSSVGSLLPPPSSHSSRHYHKAYYHRHSSRKVPEGHKLSPTGSQGNNGKPIPKSQDSSSSKSSSRKSTTDGSKPCCSSSHRARTVSRSVQTDPEAGPSRSREERESSGRRIGSKREMKLPDSGVNMKRKAVMEAISEILKKMYANSDKGRLPGSFKGRFSSEFTCDSDMSEILHSKTTMTSYNSETEDADKASDGHSHSPIADPALMSKAKYEDNEQLRDKVAHLKWRMQRHRALKMAKRKNGERSPCGWMEALNCTMPGSPPTARERTGYAGMKRGFLLSD